MEHFFFLRNSKIRKKNFCFQKLNFISKSYENVKEKIKSKDLTLGYFSSTHKQSLLHCEECFRNWFSCSAILYVCRYKRMCGNFILSILFWLALGHPKEN